MKNLRHGDVLGKVTTLMRTYDRKDINLFLVGSVRPSKERFFNSKLSDIDLLFLCQPRTIKEYSDCLLYINNLAKQLDDIDNHIVETFFGSVSVVELYFSCLATIIGDDRLRDSDLVFGSIPVEVKSDVLPTLEVRKSLYMARATYFCHDYERLLPIADTEKARKVAKILLRGLKLVVCAHTPLNEIRAMEERLFAVATLRDIVPILKATCKRDLRVDPIFDKVLAGANIEDWSAWMVAQDEVARQLSEIITREPLSAKDLRFYETIVVVLHDMLIAGLKEILSEKDDESRDMLIQGFIDRTTSLIVKLAMLGVATLYDFELPSTPQIVKESYEVVIEHLQGTENGITGLASSVVLLEYSLKQALAYANTNK